MTAHSERDEELLEHSLRVAHERDLDAPCARRVERVAEPLGDERPEVPSRVLLPERAQQRRDGVRGDTRAMEHRADHPPPADGTREATSLPLDVDHDALLLRQLRFPLGLHERFRPDGESPEVAQAATRAWSRKMTVFPASRHRSLTPLMRSWSSASRTRRFLPRVRPGNSAGG